MKYVVQKQALLSSVALFNPHSWSRDCIGQLPILDGKESLVNRLKASPLPHDVKRPIESLPDERDVPCRKDNNPAGNPCWSPKCDLQYPPTWHDHRLSISLVEPREDTISVRTALSFLNNAFSPWPELSNGNKEALILAFTWVIWDWWFCDTHIRITHGIGSTSELLNSIKTIDLRVRFFCPRWVLDDGAGDPCIGCR